MVFSTKKITNTFTTASKRCWKGQRAHPGWVTWYKGKAAGPRWLEHRHSGSCNEQVELGSGSRLMRQRSLDPQNWMACSTPWDDHDDHDDHRWGKMRRKKRKSGKMEECRKWGCWGLLSLPHWQPQPDSLVVELGSLGKVEPSEEKIEELVEA